jgi:hypothetical protein
MRRRGPLIAGACAVLAAAAALRAQPAGRGDDRPAAGYDHIGHEGKVAVAGADPIPCSRCHAVRTNGSIAGRPTHAACFGSCHGAAPERARRGRRYPLGDRRRVCEACHLPADLDALVAGERRKLAAVYPPYAIEPDYSITFPHDRHAAPARDAGGCRSCHQTPVDAGRKPPARPAPHTRCASCHTAADTAPAMTDCRSCHQAAFGPATSPHLVRGAFPIGARFSHRRHLSRITDPRPCEGCHGGAAAAPGDEVPAPTTTDCTGCHDGKRAFSTVSTDCARCHAQPTERTRRKAATPARFSHAAHRARGMALPCATCHSGEPTGRLSPDRHAPCSDSGCHGAEFASLTPSICGVCHVGTEPWRPLHLEPQGSRSREFGSRFDHARHLGGDDAPTCTRCHRVDPRTGRTLAPRGHRACSGAGCHDAGAAPPLARCEQCHVGGLLAMRSQARRTAPWSVRARFDHRPHQRAGDQPVPCTSCHTALDSCRSVAEVPTPAKARCAGCHDGKAAFKMTGHGCARCHGD